MSTVDGDDVATGGGRVVGELLTKISDLMGSLPARGADVLTRAAWFDMKADTFAAIAEAEATLSAQAAAIAVEARKSARRLRETA